MNGVITVKYAVELTQATLEMHLFGPFMGFLYELIDTLNRAQEESRADGDGDGAGANDVSEAVAEEVFRRLEENTKSISATAASINGIYGVRPNRGLIGSLLGAQKGAGDAGPAAAATKKSLKLFSKLLQYHQHRLRALMVLESTLRNCVESFLNNIIEMDFTSVLVDIINDETAIRTSEDDDSARVRNIENFVRTTHVEESQVSIRVLEWIEYNKSQQGRRVRQWFGKNMDGEWSTHFSRHRRRSLLRLWELSLGSKYEVSQHSHSLPPSLTHSLTHSLAHSLTPSLSGWPSARTPPRRFSGSGAGAGGARAGRAATRRTGAPRTTASTRTPPSTTARTTCSGR